MPFIPEIDLTAIVQLIGYPGLFIIIFLESGVFFGFFLPGASLLFTTGLLAAAGIFNIWFLVPMLILAAILGDNVGYWFGAKVGIKLFSRPDSRFFRQSHVDRTRVFFEKYGTRTILFARFIPIVRTFAPILAGVGSMNYRIFVMYNIIGATLWVSGALLLGYLVGSTIPNAERYLTPIILVIIVLSSIPLILTWWRKEKVSRVKVCPRVVIFDIDDTLTESFKAPNPMIIEKLKKLLELMPVALMSAAGFPRIKSDFLVSLSQSPHLSRLYIFPNSTAECFLYENREWKQEYGNKLTIEERTQIKDAVLKSVAEIKVLKDIAPHGQQMIDREALIAFTAVGVDASDEDKKRWDVDRAKRTALRKAILKRIPEFEVLIGGRTTIDITRKGLNKAHGVRWIAKRLDIKPREMLFVGDALYRGGNDSVVIPTGIHTASTSGPQETESIIDEIQKTCTT